MRRESSLPAFTAVAPFRPQQTFQTLTPSRAIPSESAVPHQCSVTKKSSLPSGSPSSPEKPSVPSRFFRETARSAAVFPVAR